MADHELTEEEVYALADAFPIAAARTLLTMARFPAWAIPETGFANSLEFWSKIAEQVANQVMPDGRRKILAAARRRFPSSDKFPDPPAASDPAGPARAEGAAPSGRTVSIDSSRGVQAGDHGVQYNYYFGEAGAAGGAPPDAPVRVLVIGASPDDPDLPHVRADREAHAIEKAALPHRVEVKVVLGAEATDVQRVGSFRPGIVHFVCHGDTDSLVFNDSHGEADFVKADRVADLLRFYRETSGVRLRGIVLAACDGNTLAPFFTGVADTVIAHRGKLSDPCGVAFATQLYSRMNDAPDLATAAREAAQLTAQYSAGCEPVIANLIVLTSGA